MKTKETKKFGIVILLIGIISIFSSCYESDPTPSVPEAPVVFSTMEANFFFSSEEYDGPSATRYTYFSRDGENWQLVSSSNFDNEAAAGSWSENPSSLGYYYSSTGKKTYLYYPVPTNDILIKEFVIFENKKLDKNIFLAVKTMPEDKSDTIFGSSFTRELTPINLKDSLKIGTIDSLIAKYGNQKILITFSVERFDPIKTALATYDSKNGLSYVLSGDESRLDSCLLLINDGKISFSQNLSKDSKGNLYLYPSDYGKNAKLISVKTVK